MCTDVRACFDSFELMLAVLNLVLKEQVMLHVQCACFDSWHD